VTAICPDRIDLAEFEHLLGKKFPRSPDHLHDRLPSWMQGSFAEDEWLTLNGNKLKKLRQETGLVL
jgi:hypothetical protein